MEGKEGVFQAGEMVYFSHRHKLASFTPCLHPEQHLLYGSGRCSVIIYQNEREHSLSRDGSSKGLEGGEKWPQRGQSLRKELYFYLKGSREPLKGFKEQIERRLGSSVG